MHRWYRSDARNNAPPVALVVIMQQIYYRYYHHQTRNKRFGRFIYLIKYLEGYLNQLISGSSL